MLLLTLMLSLTQYMYILQNLICRYYRGAAAAVIVYDVTNNETFNNAQEWLNELRRYSDNIVVMLLGNKCDLGDQRVVNTEDARIWAGKMCVGGTELIDNVIGQDYKHTFDLSPT
jgi:GTPase SAR1 family protein